MNHRQPNPRPRAARFLRLTARAALLPLLVLLLPAAAGGGAELAPRDGGVADAIAEQGNRALIEIRRDASRLAPPALPRPQYTARSGE